MKKRFLFALFLLQIFLFAAGCATQTPPKYVFLFIGDGMGIPHTELARKIYGPLNMDKLPVRGSVSTLNALGKTTDSAASGTAYACGIKTQNGRLGIDAEGNRVNSNALCAKKSGRMVAILTTVGANNATPAAFYAHVMGRGEAKTIMAQYPESRFDILAGSGIDGMKNAKQEDFLSGKAYQLEESANETADAEDFRNSAVKVIARNDAPFFALSQLTRPVFVYSAGVDNLGKYVEKSIELMSSSPKGFFMMAEGGHIDHGGHRNDAGYMLSELEKFDKAIGVALEFYQKHPNETLIIVSADHNTGGLQLTDHLQKEFLFLSPASLNLQPAQDTKELILAKMAGKGLLCNDTEKSELEQLLRETDPAKKANTLLQFAGKVIDRHAGIRWTTRGHTSEEVPLFAIGKDAELFLGSQKNSDVGAKLKAFYQGK